MVNTNKYIKISIFCTFMNIPKHYNVVVKFKILWLNWFTVDNFFTLADLIYVGLFKLVKVSHIQPQQNHAMTQTSYWLTTCYVT